MAKEDDWFDGSQIITLEMHVRFPDRITILDPVGYYEHMWSFYRVDEKLQRSGDTLLIHIGQRQLIATLLHFAYNSAIKCMLFPKQETGTVLPWPWALRMCEEYEQPGTAYQAMEAVRKLSRYADPHRHSIGWDRCGVNRIRLDDGTVPGVKLMM